MFPSLKLVSIIIPLYNRSSLISETIDSILSQSYKNWECILVDDSSTDDSYEIALNYTLKDSRIKIFRRPKYLKKGANACRNFGFTKSKGEFIQWFDSDDLMSFDMIEKKLNSFRSYHADMVVCDAYFFASDNENKMSSTKKSIAPISENPAFEYFSGNFWFGTPQAIFRREVISSLPYVFNTNLHRNQETELYVRILLKDLKISYLNERLIFIRLHDNSISASYTKMSDENKIALDLDAYISMFHAFKVSNKLSEEVFTFFSIYFFRCLRKMKVDNFKFVKLFIFSMKFNLFPSRFLGTKVFLYRFLKL